MSFDYTFHDGRGRRVLRTFAPNPEPADILIEAGTGLISDAIRAWTPRDDDGIPIVASHVGIITERWPRWVSDDDPTGPPTFAMTVEATAGGVKYRPIARPNPVLIVRPMNITNGDAIVIGNAARAYYYRRYGFAKLAVQAIDYALGRRLTPGRDLYLARRALFMDDYPICSWIVAHPYGKAGYDFGVAARAANPHDIHEFVVRSGHYRTVAMSGEWTHRPPTIGEGGGR